MNLFTKLIIFLAIVGALATAGLLLTYGYYNQEIQKDIVTDEKELVITIEKGMGVKEISLELAKRKVIQFPELLQIYMKLNPGKTIQAGYYHIKLENMDLIDLVDEFQKGSFESKLTFLEGWRIEEYVDYLRDELGDEFADKFAASEYIKEGYLFPDTYVIDKDYKAENLASWMRNNFSKRVTSQMIDDAGLKGLSLEEVVIIASIVEREMNDKKERPIVAGILIKRLQNSWALQADATIQYAKGTSKDWWPIVTRADYAGFDSSYNTYLNKGLPPGPISNPGLNSIESVIDYQETPYWFYISGTDGKTYYAKTLEEHNLNIEKYLK